MGRWVQLVTALLACMLVGRGQQSQHKREGTTRTRARTLLYAGRSLRRCQPAKGRLLTNSSMAHLDLAVQPSR